MERLLVARRRFFRMHFDIQRIALQVIVRGCLQGGVGRSVIVYGEAGFQLELVGCVSGGDLQSCGGRAGGQILRD